MYPLADAISVKEDWGHSSNIVGVELCQMARAKHLCMFHHEPIFDDERSSRCCRRRGAWKRSRAPDIPSGSRRPGTGWRSSSEASRKRTSDVVTPAPGHAADDVHWSERPWVRAIRGGRGRPLGLVLLLAPWSSCSARAEAVRALRLAFFDALQFRAPRERVSGPAVIVDDRRGEPRALRAVALAAHTPRAAHRADRPGRPAAIGLDIVMPEPDRLSPDRLARLIPGIDPELAGRLAAPAEQ